MSGLTLPQLDERLRSRLQRLAEQQGISLPQAALLLMRRGAGLPPHEPPHQPIGHALDDFIGDWTVEEEQEFLKAVRSLPAT